MLPYKEEKTILVCDDDLEVRRFLEIAIRSLGYSVHSARDGEELISLLQNSESEVSAILLDMVMPNRCGADILQELRAMNAEVPVIMISGMSSTQDAVAAMKNGATDFVCKPLTYDELGRVLRSVLETGRAVGKSQPRTINSLKTFTGSSRRIKEIQARVKQIGWSGAPVVIQGETGSGKEVLARALHAQSTRANKPFLKLNCAALPAELVESELFGYERGAFTGAFQRKPGIFELADGGTILLDEIGDMDVRLQAKLLQVLQDQEFRRVGGKDTIKVDVRVIAATHRDLEKSIRAGTFREDLYYRLNVITLHVPPLRERGEDIVRIGEFLIKKHGAQGHTVPDITPVLEHALLAYDWPGNVRELENYMRRLVIFKDPDVIASELLSRINSKSKPVASISRTNEDTLAPSVKAEGITVLEQVTKVNRQAETEAILTALNSTRWNRKQAAAVLKVDYKSLLYKMKRLGIDESPAKPPQRATPRPGIAKAVGSG